MSKVTMWRSRWRCVIKPAYSFSFLLSINIFWWQNVFYFLDAPRTSMEALDWTFAVVRSTINRSALVLNSGRDVTWKNTYFDKRSISAVGALSVFLWLSHDTRGHDRVTRLSYDLRADIQSRHISTHDLYDSFILYFYQNEVANKLDKIHNQCVQLYESRGFYQIKLTNTNIFSNHKSFIVQFIHLNR